MRSINTSLISVLPIIALIVVAVWLLGVGTLKDLALVQLVGVIVGTYSSIFFATPLLVTLRERTELVRNHTRRVQTAASAAAAATEVDASDADAGMPSGAAAGSRRRRPAGAGCPRRSGRRRPHDRHGRRVSGAPGR